MIKKAIGATSFIGMWVGALAVAGTIENDGNIIPSLLFTLLCGVIFGGFCVMEEMADEENYTELHRDDFNRPYFLH